VRRFRFKHTLTMLHFVNSIIRRLTGVDARIDNIVRRREPATVTPDEYTLIYDTGCDLILPYIKLENHETRSAQSNGARREVERGIQLLDFILIVNPQNWSAYWIIGKGYQALGNSEMACDALGKAFAIEKGNPDVAREYMYECLQLGRSEDCWPTLGWPD
jgi:hypothetical protein